MNKTKIFIIFSVGSMLIISIYMGYVLSNHMRQDSSLERGRLTKEYKKIKDTEYSFDKKNAQKLYSNLCMKCHAQDLRGSEYYPSLKDSPVLKDKLKLVKVLTHGLQGKIVRGEKTFDGQMPGFKFIPNKDMADLINFLKENTITHKELIDLKLKIVNREKPWTDQEL
jgi:mono/diheme cytochrome c family protein